MKYECIIHHAINLIRLLFRGSRSSGVSPPSQVDRSFRIKSFRVGKLVELGNERESGTIPGIVCEVKDDHILVDIGRLSAQMLNELVRKGRRRNSTAFFLRQRSHVDQAHSVKRSHILLNFVVKLNYALFLGNTHSKRLPVL